jgi:methionyl-tRNA formyltransferase
LQALAKLTDVVAVVSQPTKASGRGGKQTEKPAVVVAAEEMDIPVLQPEAPNAPEFLAQLRELNADLFVTAAYGQMLSADFIRVPKRALINIHPSLLPKYRGATPVQSALLDGVAETGVTVLFTVLKMDAGAIIAQRKSPIAKHETADLLLDRLFREGGELLAEAIEKLRDPNFVGVPQDPQQVSKCRKFAKEDGRINWNDKAEAIWNRWRAFFPWPGIFTFCGGKRVALVRLGEPVERSLNVGALEFARESEAILVGCGAQALPVLALKQEGQREIPASAYWNGLKSKGVTSFDSQ